MCTKCILFYTAFITKERFQILEKWLKRNLESQEMSFIFSELIIFAC